MVNSDEVACAVLQCVVDTWLHPIVEFEMQINVSDLTRQQLEEDHEMDTCNESSDKGPRLDLALASHLRGGWAEKAAGMWRTMMSKDGLHGMSPDRLQRHDGYRRSELHDYFRATSATKVLWQAHSQHREHWARDVVRVQTMANESVVRWCQRQAVMNSMSTDWLSEMTEWDRVAEEGVILYETNDMLDDWQLALSRLAILRESVWH